MTEDQQAAPETLLDKLEATIAHYATRDAGYAFDKLNRVIRAAVDDACYDEACDSEEIKPIIQALLAVCGPLISEVVRAGYEERAINNLLRKSP